MLNVAVKMGGDWLKDLQQLLDGFIDIFSKLLNICTLVQLVQSCYACSHFGIYPNCSFHTEQ